MSRQEMFSVICKVHPYKEISGKNDPYKMIQEEYQFGLKTIFEKV
jgi:hypothetical protein